MDIQRRRRYVHSMIAVNGLGCLICSILLVDVFKENLVPWMGLAGVTVMFLGIVVPVYREVQALRISFDAVEDEAMRGIRHRSGDDDYQEVFVDQQSKATLDRARGQLPVTLLLTVVAWALVIAEAARWFTQT